jgi:hypothetical protein
MGTSSKGLQRKENTNRVSYTDAAAADLVTNLRRLVPCGDTDREDVRRLAEYFDTFARSALEDAGYVPTRAGVAHIVGETPAHYTGVLTGKEGSLTRVLSWVLRWQVTFLPPMDFQMATCETVKNPSLPPIKGEKPVEKEPPPLSPEAMNTLARYSIKLAGSAAQRQSSANDADDRDTT